MFAATDHPPGASRRRRLRPIAAGLLVAAFAAAAAAQPPLGNNPAAQPPGAPGPTPTPPAPGGPVAEFQNLLRSPAGPDLAARHAAETKLIDSMDLEQLSRVLLLPDWAALESAVPRTEAERARIQTDLAARGVAANDFIAKAKEAVKAAREDKAASDLRKSAVVTLIGETAAAVKTLDTRSQIPGPLTGGAPLSPISELAQKISELSTDLIALTGKDQSEQVREAAARALTQIQLSIPAPAVVNALGDLFADPDNPMDLRLAAVHSLDEICRGAAAEMQRSLGQREDVRYGFLDLTQAAWLVVLQKGLAADEPPEVRRTCLDAFAHLAQEMLDISVIPETNEAPPRILDPKMIEEMRQAQDKYFHRIADVFTALQANAGPLSDAVRDRDPQVRQAALTILVDLANVRDRLHHLAAGETGLPTSEPGRTGPTPTDTGTKRPGGGARRDLAPALILAVADEPAPPPSPQSQQTAYDALARMMAGTVEGVAAALRSQDVPSRLLAMDVLENLGPAAFPAVNAMIGALHDPDRSVRWAAARTLGELADQETDKQKYTPEQLAGADRGLADLLRDDDVGVRVAAVTSLQHFGPRMNGGPTGPILVRMINHSQTDAALAIVPPEACPGKGNVLRVQTPSGQSAVVVAPEVDQDLLKGDPTVRIGAFRALEAVDDGASLAALPEAVIALKDPTSLVRQAAADFLGRVGPQAPDLRQRLIDSLRDALNDPDGDVRRAAGGALLRLIPKPK